MSDLKALRAVAERATPGEWIQEEHSNAIVNIHEDSFAVAEEVYMSEDRYFIATFNPVKVLELLDRLEAAEQVLERVQELHTPTVYSTGGSGGGRGCLECDDLSGSISV